LACAIGSVSAQSCATSYGNVTLPTAAFNTGAMSTCCWYQSATCCYNPNTNTPDKFYLNGVRNQLNRYSVELTSECYYQFANVLCAVCAPDTVNFFDLTVLPWRLRLCAVYCNNLYLACNNPNDIQTLFYLNPNATLFTQSDQFCTSAITAAGLIDTTVTTTGTTACYNGVDINIISEQAGVCLNHDDNSSFVLSYSPITILIVFALTALLAMFSL